MTRAPYHPSFGAVFEAGGVRFRLWAPEADRVALHRRAPAGEVRVADLSRMADDAGSGIWELFVEEAGAGDRYAYSVDGGRPRPDPASRFQPEGVHAWSEVINPHTFQWTDAPWSGLQPTRAVIYELHVGTFSPESSFAGAAARLPYLKELGITAIEVMPVADFAGARNWGYDGAALFAPSRAYGRPDDFRALVDAAHALGLAVLLDVVYNHLGPEGAYLASFSRQFLTSRHQTPWGGAVNLDDLGSGAVRRLLMDNALHWISEYHLDGLRLDATHSLIDSGTPHFVAELVAAVHASADPPPLLYAEDHRNLAALVEERGQGGWGLDGVWADDFHHVVRSMLAGDRHGYYVDYDGNACELSTALRKGWLFTGQPSAHEAAPRGTEPSRVPMRKAVICVQNHDQVGNRALGDRLHHRVDPAAWRAAVAVLLTAPMTPLLFMGQEWAASSPFQFFTDFEPELGRQIVEGRRREFRAFPEFATGEAAARIPNPQSRATFEASRLRWDERDGEAHAPVLALHRALLRLRAQYAALQGSDLCQCAAEALDASTVAFHREAPGGPPVVVVARLRGDGRVTVPFLDGTGRLLLDTEAAAFVPESRPPRVDLAARSVEFDRPGALIFAGPPD